MAKELSGFYTPGTTGIYAILWKSAQVYNGSTYEDFLTANWGTYDIPLTEDSTTGFFAANMPAGQPAGDYEFILYLETSPGTPAPTDARISGTGAFSWDGTAIVNERAIYNRIGEPTGDDIAMDLADMMGDTFNRTTDSLEALRNRGDAAWTTIAASAIRSAVGLANANLDTQLSTIDSTADGIYGIVSSSGVVVAVSSKTGYTISGTITTLDALNTSVASQFTTIKGAGFDAGTDTLEEIANAIAAISGSDCPTASEIATAVEAALGGATVVVTSPVASTGNVRVTRGDDYSSSDSRSLTWTGESSNIWPDLTAATIEFNVDNGRLSVAGSVVTPTGTQQVRVQLTAAQTTTLPARAYDYDVRATLTSGRIVTLIRGRLVVDDTESG